jgi:hypothetical protein
MIYANIHSEGKVNNSLFSKEDVVHKYNPTDTSRLMRQEFLRYGIELNTPDLNCGKTVAFDLYAEGQALCPRERPRYLIAMENPYINKLNSNLEFLRQFDLVFAWDVRVQHLPNVVPAMIPHPLKSEIFADIKQRDIFSCLINANKAFKEPLPTDLYLERINTIKWYERYAPEKFSLFGRGWDKPPPSFTPWGRFKRGMIRLSDHAIGRPAFPSFSGEISDKAKVLCRTRFSYCYENSRDLSNYITEKIFDSMTQGCIPVYWGADNILDYLPSDCFIDRRLFSCTQAVHEFLLSIKEDDYVEYQNSIKTFLVGQQSECFKSTKFVQSIVDQIIFNLRKNYLV